MFIVLSFFMSCLHLEFTWIIKKHTKHNKFYFDADYVKIYIVVFKQIFRNIFSCVWENANISITYCYK